MLPVLWVMQPPGAEQSTGAHDTAGERNLSGKKAMLLSIPPTFRIIAGLSVLGISTIATHSSATETWYVDAATCPATGSGTPGDPFCGIQDGIIAATNGDQVLVSAGTYTENIHFLGHVISVCGKDGAALTVISGAPVGRTVQFSNNEGRDTLLEGFTITGGNGGILCTGASPTIRNCIVRDSVADNGAGIDLQLSASPLIQGCVITGNTANFTAGGINCNGGSSPTIDHCTISFNYAPLSAGGISVNLDSHPHIVDCLIHDNSTDGSAGGIGSGQGSEPTIERCTITGNTSVTGAGIDCYESSPTIRDCLIESNTARDIGGGINCKMDASPRITNTIFRDNEATLFNGGGVLCNLRSHAVLSGCTISNNRAVNGAGVFIFDDSTARLYRCLIENNVASGFAGGIDCAGADPIIDECIVRGNTAEAGAGIGCGSGSPLVTNTLIHGNHATQIGGGILSNDSHPNFFNCLIIDNTAGFGGGGLYAYNFGEPALVNCTLHGNEANTGWTIFSGAFSNPTLQNCILWASGASIIFNEANSSTTVTYSLVQGGYFGVGNISGPPSFAAGGFRLAAGSAGIDAGLSPGAPVEWLNVDFDGAPRLFDDIATSDTGAGKPTFLDMGAYEYRDCNANGIADATDVIGCAGQQFCRDDNQNGVPDTCESPADLNMDGTVNLSDAKRFLLCMAGPDETDPPAGCRTFDFRTADLDATGSVDLADAAGLQTQFSYPE